MRPLDYLRLGVAGLKSHKRQTLTVTLLVGLLFAILTTATLILSGLERNILNAMLGPTDGQVILQSSIDLSVCGESCDIPTSLEQVRSNVKKYGGEVVDFTQPSGFMGTYYQLSGENFTVRANTKITDDTPQILVPLSTAASLIGYDLPEAGSDSTTKLRAAQEIRSLTTGKLVTTTLGQQYYIADILPSGDLAGNLAFANLGQSNPLDLFLSQIYTGSSLNFALSTPTTTDTSTQGTADDAQTTSPDTPAADASAQNVEAGATVAGTEGAASTVTTVFAKFTDLESAYAYYQDPVNFCDPISLASLSCSTDYRFTTQSIISNPLGAYGTFQNIWEVFQIVAIVIIVIAVVIAVATYSRIIGKDQKIIHLYFALGANDAQVRGIYFTYLLGLSLLALLLAGLLGTGVALILSWAWQDSLLQLFELGLNVQFEQVWLLGLHPVLGVAAASLIMTPLLTVLVEHKQLSARR